MFKIATNDLQASIRFLKDVHLPTSSMEEGLPDGTMVPKLPEYKKDQQAVTVGSQISEFAKSVPVELRPHIDNAFLLAQLAANYQIEEFGGGTTAWHAKYIEVLSNVGWVIEDQANSLRTVESASLEVHREIIPLIAAALGPAAAAASIVLTALKGLDAMTENQPWITLFNRESQRASANQFQVSYVDVDAERMPRLTLSIFELNASKSITQVLFFKFSNAEATLSHAEAKMSINEAVFDAARNVVATRVKSRTTGYLTDLKF